MFATGKNKKLDFIVFGVPRSGTGAIARYINAVRHCICFLEKFAYEMDHNKIMMPKAIWTREGQHDKVLGKNERRIENLLNTKDISEILIGNKSPFYFLRIPEIFDELGTELSVCIVRDARSLMKSRNVRATKLDWSRGSPGLFALAEYIILLKILLKNKNRNILIFPYSSLFFDGNKARQILFEHISPDRKIEVDEKKIRFMKTKHQKKRKFGDIGFVELCALGQIEETGVCSLLQGELPFVANKMPAKIESAIAELPDGPVEFIRTYFEEIGHQPSFEHLEKLKKKIIGRF